MMRNTKNKEKEIKETKKYSRSKYAYFCCAEKRSHNKHE